MVLSLIAIREIVVVSPFPNSRRHVWMTNVRAYENGLYSLVYEYSADRFHAAVPVIVHGVFIRRGSDSLSD